jgi:hypothetical protein
MIDIEKFQGFLCLSCATPHKQERDALECCGRQVESVYRCEQCMDTYWEECDAWECCASHEVEKAEGYLCPECDELHEEKNDALTCCKSALEHLAEVAEDEDE